MRASSENHGKAAKRHNHHANGGTVGLRHSPRSPEIHLLKTDFVARVGVYFLYPIEDLKLYGMFELSHGGFSVEIEMRMSASARVKMTLNPTMGLK